MDMKLSIYAIHLIHHNNKNISDIWRKTRGVR